MNMARAKVSLRSGDLQWRAPPTASCRARAALAVGIQPREDLALAYDRIARLLADQQVVVLDGAFGTELDRRGVKKIHHPHIWSAAGLTRAPQVVLQIHRDYALAGADVITVGAFRTNCTALRKAGLDHLSRPLTHLAVNLAQEVKSMLWRHRGEEICIAGNLTSVEDCYSPGLSPGEGASSEHAEKARYLAEAGCDLILIESMPTVAEGTCAVRAARLVAKPVWLSFVLKPPCLCRGPQLLDGTDVGELPGILADANAVPDALLFNCSWPDAVANALCAVAPQRDGLVLPLGAYANVERQAAVGGPWVRIPEMTPQAYARAAVRWVELGAQIVGGCCGTTPDDVRALRQAVDSLAMQPVQATGGCSR
jgi:S-methylmethionine-dependent homocysteine/selenocysteine methylase